MKTGPTAETSWRVAGAPFSDIQCHGEEDGSSTLTTVNEQQPLLFFAVYQ